MLQVMVEAIDCHWLLPKWMKARGVQGSTGGGAKKLLSGVSGIGYYPSSDQSRFITDRSGKAGKNLLQGMSVTQGRKQPFMEPCMWPAWSFKTQRNPQEPSPTPYAGHTLVALTGFHPWWWWCQWWSGPATRAIPNTLLKSCPSRREGWC